MTTRYYDDGTIPEFPDLIGLASGEGLPSYRDRRAYARLLERFHNAYGISPFGVQAMALLGARYGLRALVDLVAFGLQRMERNWGPAGRDPFSGACDLARVMAPVAQMVPGEMFQSMMTHYDTHLRKDATPQERHDQWEKSAHMGVEGAEAILTWIGFCNQALLALHHGDELTARAILLRGPGLAEKDPVLLFGITAVCLQLCDRE